MATFHRMEDDSGREVVRVYIKGAPDQLLSRAATVYAREREPIAVDDEVRNGDRLWVASGDGLAAYDLESGALELEWPLAASAVGLDPDLDPVDNLDALAAYWHWLSTQGSAP